MRGDGDGWAVGPDGEKRWGRHGAAGLLLRAPLADGRPAVLLQHRAAWSHQGGTWALPGGARDSHESTVDAAVREAHEEAGIDLAAVTVRAERVTSGLAGGWTYTTVVADATETLVTSLNQESTELRWVPEPEVEAMPLHSGFAEAWPSLRTSPVRMLLDTANVLGASGPTGWWRDRPGATSALLADLAAVLPRTVEIPDGTFGWVPRVEAVLEGHARDATIDDVRIPVHSADGSGDDELTRLASTTTAVVDSGVTVVVTADRGLRARLPEGTIAMSPSAVLGWL
ncbi:NUDIX hydrolase [Rhodococcus pyridinivorans]|uniref:NUDIX hydrolase n=1 Tax=Rhodococcus pyridinivorans TaxID=103816 RepID=UPI00030340C2|nr:NUDIX hydrolase [Rhodococcus pyridinivorans]AWZ26332.1 NUDIX hydrolase [Rhodococcus pyridinivorans]MCW3472499.1 NUDIX hydrolase [Rhodococcus pyridinivorans]